MDPPPTAYQRYLSQPSRRNRLVSFLLAAAVTVLMALLMLAMGDFLPADAPVPRLVAMQFAQESGAKVTHVKPAARHMQAPAAPRAVPQPQVVRPPVLTSPFLHLSHEDFAAADISKLPSHAEGSGTENSSSTYGPGEGPGGVNFHNAEIIGNPAGGIQFYLHNEHPEGEWGQLACKMVDHDRVEDCHELDESPGSGMARAMRLASWDFHVKPSTLNGRPEIGEWVRIKFTFTKPAASEPAEALPGADNGR